MGFQRRNRECKGRAEGNEVLWAKVLRGKEGVQGGGRAAGGEGVQMKRGGREECSVLEGKGVAGGEERVLGALGENGGLEKEQ